MVFEGFGVQRELVDTAWKTIMVKSPPSCSRRSGTKLFGVRWKQSLEAGGSY